MTDRTSGLDSVDLKILAFLRKDNTTSLRLIGEAVHLSTAAVQRRVVRLRESGVIEANVAIVNRASLGQSITIVVELELASHRASDIEAAKTRFRGHPAVQECLYVTGETDFIIVLGVSSIEDYAALCVELFDAGGLAARYRSFVVMERVKQAHDLGGARGTDDVHHSEGRQPP